MKKFIIDHLDEVCGNCSERYGQHYGGERAMVCEKANGWLGGMPVDYTGTYWKPTGVYRNKEDEIYYIKKHVDKRDPNSAFKMRKNNDIPF